MLNGFATGLFLQLAVGPVFFYVLGITLERSLPEGLAAVVAVTLVDFLYIGLSVAGLGRLLEKDRARRVAGVVGSLALCVFGALFLRGAIGGLIDAARGQAGAAAASAAGGAVKAAGIPPNVATPAAATARGLFSAFAGAFVLTLSSPLTIVFWSGVFSARAAEKGYGRAQLAAFGLGAGSATAAFLSAAMSAASLAKAAIPERLVGWANAAVGAALVAYGITRLAKSLKPKGKA